MIEEKPVVDVSEYVEAPIVDVWRAFVTPEGRDGWWSYLQLDPVVGARFAEHWTDDQDRAQVTSGFVVKFDPPNLLVLTWADDGWPARTRVEIRLRESGTGTALHLRHTGWEALPGGRDARRRVAAAPFQPAGVHEHRIRLVNLFGNPRGEAQVTQVTLRPVRDEDLAIFERELYPRQASELQWFGHRAVAGERRAFAETGLLGDDGGVMTICAGDRVAGRIQWWKTSWGPPATSWCWTFGITVGPGHRGHGVGTEAQRQLAAYLFAHTRAHRIEASTDVLNHAEQRALEKAGFRREGVLRGAQWRGGAWHDQILYAILRTDVDPAGPA
ncbi:GNAT family N-acetyltransferase [Rhizohabitans arisaemae]|uniref:GNAT family N-acetyltransferase n=1 Tax=Rhizohabitans arisaemae TaxID=2720610 RepID=UPI0024B2778F|nr:GNAT family N-acetyltransferase [Rhizohabitans arisaemae]